MNEQFCMRAATQGDIPALQELIERSVQALSKHDYSAEQINGALRNVLGPDTQLIRDATYYVATLAVDPKSIAGCGGWSYRRTLYGSDDAPNREMSLLDPATEAAKIRAIFVNPSYARRALGTRILQYCEDAAERAGFRSLEMGSTLTGVHLYERRGYRGLERVDIQLPNGELLGVLRMTKEL